MRGNNLAVMQYLQAAACIVVVCWGIMAASHVLSLILISLLLAYCVLPFPKWLLRRFRLSKSVAVALTVGLVITIYFVLSVALFEAGLHMEARLPIYEEHISVLLQRFTVFLGAHGIRSDILSVKSLYTSERMIEFSRIIVPKLVGLFSDRLMVSLLSLIFLVEMANPEGAESGTLARNLAHYGRDVQRFISISAKTGAINALANLVVFVVLGVDFPVVWCVLYFFLHFIPNFGFIIALVPPSLLALLMFGWKRALLVAGCLILTQILGDYLVTPMFMAKGLDISPLEIILSLMIWGFLLGAAGAILAIPLTLVLRKFMEKLSEKEERALAPAPG